MKKIIALMLIIAVLGLLYGCAQKTEQNTATSTTKGTEAVPSTAPTAAQPAADTAAISNDIDSISKEIASIDANDTGDVMTPVSAADIAD